MECPVVCALRMALEFPLASINIPIPMHCMEAGGRQIAFAGSISCNAWKRVGGRALRASARSTMYPQIAFAGSTLWAGCSTLRAGKRGPLSTDRIAFAWIVCGVDPANCLYRDIHAMHTTYSAHYNGASNVRPERYVAESMMRDGRSGFEERMPMCCHSDGDQTYMGSCNWSIKFANSKSTGA